MRFLMISFAIALLATCAARAADSLNVELVGREPLGQAFDVYVSGNRAYLCAGGALVILDVSNPSQPIQLSRINMPGIALDVSVDGSYAYVADGEAGLRVIDISDPKNPRESGFYDTPDAAWRVYISDNRAYVADGWSGLRVIDISDPKEPAEVGFYDTPDLAWGVHVSGSYAYVADGNGGLYILRWLQR